MSKETNKDYPILEFDGYYGSVNVKNGYFYGEILNIENANITYDGHSYDELFNEFIDALDDYIEMCKSFGIKISKAVYYDKGMVTE